MRSRKLGFAEGAQISSAELARGGPPAASGRTGRSGKMELLSDRLFSKLPFASMPGRRNLEIATIWIPHFAA